MERLTAPAPGGGYESAASREALLARLALYENLHADVLQSQSKTAAQLEILRAQGKEKSVRFREHLAQKLTNAAILAALQAHGLEP